MDRVTPATSNTRSLDFLVGQLFVVHLDPQESLIDSIRLHRQRHFGGYFLEKSHLEDADRTRRLTHRLRRHTTDVPPPIISIDEEGGLVTNIGHFTTPAPSPAVLGTIDHEDVTEDVYQGIGEKLRALGFNTVFAPCLDVNTENFNPVIGTRSFGAFPELVHRHGTAALAGLKKSGIASCVKHFPGHGATTLDSHLTLPRVDANRKTLTERELDPFHRVLAVDSPPPLVMTAHVSYPALEKAGVPATLSPAILQEILRREMGFQGVVITDSMEMQGITEKYGPERAAVEAILAGADLLLYAMDASAAVKGFEGVKKAVEDEKISEQRLHLSLDRVFRLREKFRSQTWSSDEEAEAILNQDHEQAFFESALEAVQVEGNAGVLTEIAKTEGTKLVVLPRQADPYRFLPLEVVREQLEPAGFRVVDVSPKPLPEEIGRIEGQAAEASVVVVGTASRGKMSPENQALVQAVTRRDVIKVGVALLDPTDADQMMTANCRLKTFGFTTPHLWAMCQKLLD